MHRTTESVKLLVAGLTCATPKGELPEKVAIRATAMKTCPERASPVASAFHAA